MLGESKNSVLQLAATCTCMASHDFQVMHSLFELSNVCLAIWFVLSGDGFLEKDEFYSGPLALQGAAEGDVMTIQTDTTWREPNDKPWSH